MTDQKQTYKNRHSDLLIAERAYPWVDRVLILLATDRSVLLDTKFSYLDLTNWEPITPQGDDSEPQSTTAENADGPIHVGIKAI